MKCTLKEHSTRNSRTKLSPLKKRHLRFTERICSPCATYINLTSPIPTDKPDSTVLPPYECSLGTLPCQHCIEFLMPHQHFRPRYQPVRDTWQHHSITQLLCVHRPFLNLPTKSKPKFIYFSQQQVIFLSKWNQWCDCSRHLP